MRIIHIITNLNSGGAENMLYKLLKNRKNIDNQEVITLFSGGFYTEKLKNMGIKVHELELDVEKQRIKSFKRLIKLIKNGDIIQSWMYHSDLISFIFGKILLRKKVIWGIRRSYIEKEHMKKETYLIAKLCSYFSKYTDAIVSCTKIGKKNHSTFGYKKEKIHVISNGFELDDFCSSNNINSKLSILNIARWEVLKDHNTLLQSLKILKANNIDFKLLLVGNQIDEKNQKLVKLIEENNLSDDVELLGVRKDIPELMANADLYVSSSISEGFPNVIGEAMASSLFCVATDAGDTKYILGGNGIIVPPEKPDKLAEGIIEAINMNKDEREQLVEQAKRRVEEKFSIEKIVQQYEDLYIKIYNE